MAYTLAPSETWKLESVVVTLQAAFLSQSLVPTLVVRDSSGAVIAEVRAARSFS